MSTSLDALSGRPTIVGGGLAGMLTALHLAPEPVALIAQPLSDSSSILAQGGFAAALGDDDTAALHAADTIAAGGGLCDADIVRLVTEAARGAVETLIELGARFDRGADGRLARSLEAAHSRRRILHAAGDATGRELVRVVAHAIRDCGSISLVRGAAESLVVRDGAIGGVMVDGCLLATGRVVIATGGLGSLFVDSTNPTASYGHGLALAARAGAQLADLEFIQFHPTALDTATRPMPLISEAVRGDGAILIDEAGRRFLAALPGAELAPRDVVARAIASHIASGHRVYIDARAIGATFASRFPSIDALCRTCGIDIRCQPIPVRPAAHYHMGGVAVDADGRSSIDGLWAVGEVACTGLHGANRLASNSLLEAAVFARRVAESILGTSAPRWRPAPHALPRPRPDPTPILPIVSAALGLTRSATDLARAIEALLPVATSDGPAGDPAIVALMMAVSATKRKESRGAHFRTDFPDRLCAQRSQLTLSEALEFAIDTSLPTARHA